MAVVIAALAIGSACGFAYFGALVELEAGQAAGRPPYKKQLSFPSSLPSASTELPQSLSRFPQLSQVLSSKRSLSLIHSLK